MEEKQKVILAGIIFIVLVVLAIAIYYFFILDRGGEQPTADEVVEQALPSASEDEEKAPETEAVEPLQVDLNKSDPVIRDLIKGITSSPQLTNWAKTNDLILKFVAGVDNIANGQSPRAQVDFFTIKD